MQKPTRVILITMHLVLSLSLYRSADESVVEEVVTEEGVEIDETTKDDGVTEETGGTSKEEIVPVEDGGVTMEKTQLKVSDF